MMFATILTSGIQMLSKAGFTQRNITIAACPFPFGIGFTAASETENLGFPEISVFFLQMWLLSICSIHSFESILPKDMILKREVNKKETSIQVTVLKNP